MTGFLKGSATAMITPFTETGVDLESFGEMIEYQIDPERTVIICRDDALDASEA